MSADVMVQAAERWLGTPEPNAIQTWYRDRNGPAYAGNFPWCDASITRWSADAGEWDAVCLGTDRAYTPEHANAFVQAGRWTYGTAGIRRGDIVFFDWSMSGRIANIDHVGIVTDVLPGGQVATIEGNTMDVCARRVRGPEVIVGYGRPAYGQAGPGQRTPADPQWPGRLLRLASPMLHGDDVRRWQQRMWDRGWSITADGWYGPASAAVARQFQAEKGLTADGIVGSATWACAFRTDNIT
ncbi:peptidoglycan-binding protein [Kitasatospora sp. NPDC004614]|uniref:peptidoglycan-binding protein n=1 Tax=unclassified Kitasatospora TaxID=2633591 RepID=UPI00368B22F8